MTPHEATRAIVLGVAKKHRIPIKEVFGPRRFRQFVRARHEAIRAVAEAKPHLSMPQLGAIFSRDHTTILYVLGRRGNSSRLSSLSDTGAT